MNIIKIFKNLNEPNINKEFFNSKNRKKIKKNKIQTEKNNIDEMIEKFKKDGIKYLKTLNIEDSKKLFTFTNNSYTNYNPIISNEYYDILKDYIIKNGVYYDDQLSSTFLKKYKTK